MKEQRYMIDGNKYRQWITDTETNHYLSEDEMFILLNQQDAKIKELEEQLSMVTMYHGCDALVDKLKQENLQLKEKIKQSQNEKAIEMLKRVNKRFIESGDCFLINGCELKEYINDRIKELRCEK